MASLHWDVNCDGCGSTSLVHYRYKCLRCADYDLCKVCHENGVETGGHQQEHPFQCLLDREARELHFAGEPMPGLCADSFTCPVCGEMGHSSSDLVRHVNELHHSDRTAVICPLCVALPSAHPDRLNNLAGHLAIMHPTSILRGQNASPIEEDPPRPLRTGGGGGGGSALGPGGDGLGIGGRGFGSGGDGGGGFYGGGTIGGSGSSLFGLGSGGGFSLGGGMDGNGGGFTLGGGGGGGGGGGFGLGSGGRGSAVRGAAESGGRRTAGVVLRIGGAAGSGLGSSGLPSLLGPQPDEGEDFEGFHWSTGISRPPRGSGDAGWRGEEVPPLVLSGSGGGMARNGSGGNRRGAGRGVRSGRGGVPPPYPTNQSRDPVTLQLSSASALGSGQDLAMADAGPEAANNSQVRHLNLPIVQVPHVRFVLPGSAPLALGEDLSDSDGPEV